MWVCRCDGCIVSFELLSEVEDEDESGAVFVRLLLFQQREASGYDTACFFKVLDRREGARGAGAFK